MAKNKYKMDIVRGKTGRPMGFTVSKEGSVIGSVGAVGTARSPIRPQPATQVIEADALEDEGEDSEQGSAVPTTGRAASIVTGPPPASGSLKDRMRAQIEANLAARRSRR